MASSRRIAAQTGTGQVRIGRFGLERKIETTEFTDDADEERVQNFMWNVESLPNAYRKAAKKTQDGKTQDASPDPGASMEQAVTWVDAKLLRREERM